jgi:hypothetical protein
MRLILVFALALLAGTGDARAQAASPNRPRTEPLRIDPLTATISGRITTADSAAPIRRAEVRAISDRGLTRLATTDDDGRFVVRDLPAGSFTVHASKSGFVPLYFGQRRPFERRATILLTEGQQGFADVRLPRAGAIVGRIVDASGEPVMGVTVHALRRRMVEGQRRLQMVGSTDTTDDTGAYRIYGLPPGEYFVAASPRRIEDVAGRVVAEAVPGRGAPIFYPGTANRDEALRVTVDVSGEARADMQLNSVRTSRVTGVVLTANGTPAAGAMISLISSDLNFGGASMEGLAPLRIQDDAAADGTFELAGVPPGSFVLRAQTVPRFPVIDPATQRNAAPFTPTMEVATVPVVVNGDLAGLTVTTSQGGTLDVTIVSEQSAVPPPGGARVTVRSADGTEHGMSVGATSVISATATSFTPGAGSKMALSLATQSRVLVEGLPDDWTVKAMMLDGQDVIDKPIELRNGQNATLQVILTNRTSDVVGAIATPAFGGNEAAAVGAMVVVFAEDERKWEYPSRFVRTARAGARGTFQIPGLPPNEDYRAIAVDYLEEGEETDPDFLKRMSDRATRFSLREGEQRTLDLRLIQR